MIKLSRMAMGVLVAGAAACGGGGQAAAPATTPGKVPTGTGTVSEDTLTYTFGDRSVTARVDGDGEGEGEQALAVTFVDGGKPVGTVKLAKTVAGCESTTAGFEAQPDLGDPRLVEVSLLCDSGEDIMSRSIVAGLVFIGDADDAPALLWEGTGSYSNQMDMCVSVDVPTFRKGAGGAVEVVRWTEVTLDEEGGEGGEDCTPAARKDTVLSTVAVPAP